MSNKEKEREKEKNKSKALALQRLLEEKRGGKKRVEYSDVSVFFF